MHKPAILAVAAVMAIAAPTMGLAQFGGLKHTIPGAGSNGGSSGVNPDKFLADTIETTRFVMISAAILHDAVSASHDEAALQSRIKALNETNDPKELNAHKDEMDQDIAAINDKNNMDSNLQANLQHQSAEQRERLAVAAFDFSLGAYRNVRLAQEAPHVVDAIKTNPMMVMKAGKIVIAASLALDEAKATVGMMGSLHQIMTAAKIAEPTPSETTKPQPFSV